MGFRENKKFFELPLAILKTGGNIKSVPNGGTKGIDNTTKRGASMATAKTATTPDLTTAPPAGVVPISNGANDLQNFRETRERLKAQLAHHVEMAATIRKELGEEEEEIAPVRSAPTGKRRGRPAGSRNTTAAAVAGEPRMTFARAAWHAMKDFGKDGASAADIYDKAVKEYGIEPSSEDPAKASNSFYVSGINRLTKTGLAQKINRNYALTAAELKKKEYAPVKA